MRSARSSILIAAVLLLAAGGGYYYYQGRPAPGAAKAAAAQSIRSGVAQQKDVDIAVTGGTGQFKNARGELHIHQINDNNSTDTLYLIP